MERCNPEPQSELRTLSLSTVSLVEGDTEGEFSSRISDSNSPARMGDFSSSIPSPTSSCLKEVPTYSDLREMVCTQSMLTAHTVDSIYDLLTSIKRDIERIFQFLNGPHSAAKEDEIAHRPDARREWEGVRPQPKQQSIASTDANPHQGRRLLKEQIALRIRKIPCNRGRWTSKERITLSLAQLLKSDPLLIDLLRYEKLPQHSNCVRLILHFDSNTIPNAVMKRKGSLLRFEVIPTRVFSSGPIKPLLQGLNQTSKMVPRNHSATSRVFPPESGETMEAGQIREVPHMKASTDKPEDAIISEFVSLSPKEQRSMLIEFDLLRSSLAEACRSTRRLSKSEERGKHVQTRPKVVKSIQRDRREGKSLFKETKTMNVAAEVHPPPTVQLPSPVSSFLRTEEVLPQQTEATFDSFGTPEKAVVVIPDPPTRRVEEETQGVVPWGD